MDRTNPTSDTHLTRVDSRPVLYELISYRGEIFGPYASISDLTRAAQEKWPHQWQDQERLGRGWDVQVAGLSLSAPERN